jgi:C1A family cysteine protease
LSDVVGYVKQQLPCEESVFPYEPDKLKDWKYSQGDWWTEAMVENSDLLSDKFDTPEILELDVRDVSRIKTLLASGWLVIAATAITDEMWQNGFHRLGYLTAPLYGQKRVDGHAWLLVGYDHIDGNQQWKYQGHFLVLNSWPDRKDTSPLGRGVCTLPFVTLLTEGIEAYAIRLRS